MMRKGTIQSNLNLDSGPLDAASVTKKKLKKKVEGFG
jgi:hypothetical protein